MVAATSQWQKVLILPNYKSHHFLDLKHLYAKFKEKVIAFEKKNQLCRVRVCGKISITCVITIE